MAKKEERFETIFRDGSSLKDEGIRQIPVYLRGEIQNAHE